VVFLQGKMAARLQFSTRLRSDRTSVEVVICRPNDSGLGPREGEHAKHGIALSSVKLDKT